ncbi:alpha/beta fold hydrolase [Haloferacaceae archaeon DSL9]
MHVDYGILSERVPFHAVGDGPKPLVVLPGLGDSLRSGSPSRLTAEFLGRYYYREFLDDYTVYVLSRPRGLPDGATTREMAATYVPVVERLDSPHVLGISMGGLIAQYLAIDHGDLLDRVVLGVSASHLGRAGRAIVDQWAAWARDERWRRLVEDTIAVTYTGFRKTLYPLALSAAGPLRRPPAVGGDVVVSCAACLDHDATDELDRISAPTLVIGGREDPFFPPALLRETATAIPRGTHQLLAGVGHGAFDERKADFDGHVRRFLDGDTPPASSSDRA